MQPGVRWRWGQPVLLAMWHLTVRSVVRLLVSSTFTWLVFLYLTNLYRGENQPPSVILSLRVLLASLVLGAALADKGVRLAPRCLWFSLLGFVDQSLFEIGQASSPPTHLMLAAISALMWGVSGMCGTIPVFLWEVARTRQQSCSPQP